jgi:hypothetical protein
MWMEEHELQLKAQNIKTFLEVNIQCTEYDILCVSKNVFFSIYAGGALTIKPFFAIILLY